MPELTKRKRAAGTIEQLKKIDRRYYDSLFDQCKNCQNILTSFECDCCEDFDMYEPINKED